MFSTTFKNIFLQVIHEGIVVTGKSFPLNLQAVIGSYTKNRCSVQLTFKVNSVYFNM